MTTEIQTLPPLPPWAPERETTGNGRSRLHSLGRKLIRVPDDGSPLPDDVPQRIIVVVAAFVLGLFVLGLGVFALDSWAHSGQVFPGVTVGETDVGGSGRDEAADDLDAAAKALMAEPIAVQVNGNDADLDPATLGFDLDSAAALADAEVVGREGNIGTRFFNWVRTRTVGTTVDWPVDVDEENAETGLLAVEFPDKIDSAEPTIAFDGTTASITEPTTGFGIVVPDAIDTLTAELPKSDRARVELAIDTLEPHHTFEEANAALAEVNGWIREPLGVQLLGNEATLEPDDLAATLYADASGDTFEMRVDPIAFRDEVNGEFDGLVGEKARNAGYVIEGDAVSISDAATGVGCCADGNVEIFEAALKETDPEKRVVALQEGVLEPEITRADLERFPLPVKLAEFATYHAAGGARVFNIHKLADEMRGVTVLPGQQFSVNEYIGPRTTAGGWQAAGTIVDGQFSDTPGGGISQFATTLYNALYFAGVQIDDHKAHSIYISRYPKGREATFGFPKPDVVFTNNLPGPVVVVPHYTDTSVTVEMWGVGDGRTVESIGPVTSAYGKCQTVKDTRVIRWPDGREEQEEQWTTYRRAGQSCP